VPIFAASLRDAPTTSSPTWAPGRPRDHRPRRRRHQAGDGQRGGGRRGVGRACPGRARHPDPPGAVPDVEPGRVGGLRRRDVPARRGHPGRGARVRRSTHHRRLLLQGDRRRRPAALRRRPRALRARRRASPSTTPACATPRRSSARSRSCCRPIRPSTPASATPSVSTRPSPRSGCCAPCGTPATTWARTAVRRASPVWATCRPSRARHPTRPRATPSSTVSSQPAARTRSGSPRSR
jgi:hypothetical protein